MDSNDLLKLYSDLGVPSYALSATNRQYILPSIDWVKKDLSKSMSKLFFKRKYVKEQFDCDAFSLATILVAKLCWAETIDFEASIAIGMFGFGNSISGRHALITVVHPNKIIKFYEPQLNNRYISLCEIELDTFDIRSCCVCWFF